MSLGVLGLISGFITLCAFGPYVYETIWQKVSPNRATWIIWTAEGGVILVSYWASGARTTIWMAVADLVGYIIILGLAIKLGEGGWEPLDKLCLGIALLSIPIWVLSHDPLVALLMNLVVDGVGAVPTIAKTFRDPGGESKAAWALFSLGALVNLFAINRWEFAIVVYPLYFAVGITTIAILVWWPRE